MEVTVRRQADPDPSMGRRGSRSQGFVSLGLVAAITSAVLVAVLGGGEVADHVDLQPGGTWLASTNEIVHVNGAAATADANVTLDSGEGSGLEVVERGGAVYAVDRDERPPHWFQIRAATQTVEANGDLDTPSSDLQTVTSPQGAYVIDRRGTVHEITPDGPGRSLHLPRPLGQAAVDATGTIWVPTGAGTIVAIRHGKNDKPIRIGTRRSRLDAIAIGGRIVILDQTRSRLVPLDVLGQPGQPISLDGLQGTPRIPETIETGTVLCLVDDAGDTTTMIRVDLATRTVTPFDLPATQPGPIQITGPRGYLVDRATGTIVEIDVATGTTRNLEIDTTTDFQSPSTELTVRTGVVYVNNPDTDNALVIGHDGRPRRVNKRNITPPKPREEPEPAPPVLTPQPAPGSRSGPSAPPPPSARAPGAPIPIMVSPSGPGTLALSWAPGPDNGAAITRYDLECTSPGASTGTGSTQGTSAEVGSLENTKRYTCTVRATNRAGQGPPAAFPETRVESKVPDPPAAPTITAGDTQLSVTFAPLTDDARNGATIDGYRIDCTSSDGGTPGSTDTTPTATQATVTGLTNGKTYSCTVTPLRAGASFGQPSPASNTAIPFGKPSVTGATAVSSGDRTIRVTFGSIDNGSPITGCTSRNNQTGSVSRNCGAAEFNNLAYSTSYTFTITVSNIAGTSTEVVTNPVRTNDAPPPPPPPRTVHLTGVARTGCGFTPCWSLHVTISNFQPGGSFSVTCMPSPYGYTPPNIRADGAGNGSTSGAADSSGRIAECFVGTGTTVWVVVDGIRSIETLRY